MRLNTYNASLPRAFAPIAVRARTDELSLLLSECGRGDAISFRCLHRLVAPRLMRYALQLRMTREFAEDVVQESMIAIWRQSASYNPVLASPMTWMIAIVRNKAFDAFRASRVRSCPADASLSGAMEEDDCEPPPCKWLEMRQSTAQMARCLACLRPAQREAIELAFLQELTHHEVAAFLGEPLGTVKTWIRRGMVDLRRHMAQQGSA